MEWRWQAHENLGLLLLGRYYLAGDSNDLDAAINNFSLAEAKRPHPKVTEQLALAFWHRSWREPRGPALSYEDKEQAISRYMRGTQFVEPEYARWTIRNKYHLGFFLIASYRKYGDKAELTLAIQHLEELLHNRNPEESEPDFDFRDALSTLASAYELRSAEGDKELMLECIKAVQDDWKRRAQVSSQFPWFQFLMARGWGTAALRRGDPECLEAFKLMASVLLEATVIGSKVEDKYERLRTTQNFGSTAAAAAIRFATANLAVEWLELGMSVTTRQIYQLKLDVSDLAVQHPDLFETLKRLSEELRARSGEPVRAASGLGAFVGPTNSYRFRSAYQAHVKEIRRKPGMENFLRPLPFLQLAEAARYGPVVLLSCDYTITGDTYAFIILNPSQTEPIAIPLLNIRYRSPDDDTEKQLERAGRVSKRRRITYQEPFEMLLNSLWRVIVKPVFDELEKNNIKSSRVWWCPTGVFTSFPLHAAAPIDCPYISSYTYGLEILLNARTRPGSTSVDQSTSSISQFSVVGMEKYRGRPELALPAVAREVYILGKVVGRNPGIALHKIENDEAIIDTVLSALKSSQFVHLACHGTQDQREPLNSHLLLADGNLELRRILAEDLESAKFVFLSACQTATGKSELANESMHPAGGFMAAGFKGVVGTLWRIADEDAPRVVQEVYETMEVEGGLDITLAAEGLDRAVRRMRESGVPAHRWVPFIHVGV
ncbi:hypothetical protein NP233_g10362 [Leucocoprinus birnbaumii]|uniref:CHAT domain-containing protein n=1 Tax=Leucocoprinus birnbaumii TaxID=56174 RepID=A0AAD5YRY9_9AGAR|nr:hypothetical protein NP233_g10362 [Leucocoprinus birnbaumii]